VKSFPQIAACGAAVAMVAFVAPAAADTLDPALSRLVRPVNGVSCNNGPNGIGAINDDPDAIQTLMQLRQLGVCAPDHRAFRALMAQWGHVLAPQAMRTARTTGYGGFQFSVQAVYSGIENGQSYWRNGTQGPRNPTTGEAGLGDPPPVIQSYGIVARKGFGFGLEVGMTVAAIPNSSLITGGADTRLAIIEGFGWVPDFAVGVGVRTVTGTTEFQMTTMGIDGQLGYRIPLGGQSLLTPRLGYQFVYIWGNSGLVDLTPATDELGYCGYTGNNLPGTPDVYRSDKQADGEQVFDGQPVCAGGSTADNPGSPLDFNNNVVFQETQLKRHRLIVGLEYQYDIMMVGGQAAFDVVPPADAQTNAEDSAALAGMGPQVSVGFEIGVRF